VATIRRRHDFAIIVSYSKLWFKFKEFYMSAAALMCAVQDYWEDIGHPGHAVARPKPNPLKHMRMLLGSLGNAELSTLLSDIQKLEDTGVPSEDLIEFLDRIVIMTRCDRIFPDL
jgi:hypothetical protein